MWMQVLAAAGIPIVGEAFPGGWSRFQAANPRGFFESTLVDGIHSRSRVDPTTGRALDPDEVRGVGVKVVLAGIPRTQLPFLDAVVVSVRHWRSYADSVRRAGPVFGRGSDDPAAKWWCDHWTLLEDQRARGYRCRFVTYEAVVADPFEQVRATLEWVGVPHDPQAGGRAVDPTMDGSASPDAPVNPPDPQWVPALDAMYRAAADGTLGPSFLDRWSEAGRAIVDRTRPRSRWS
ncbi:MAG: hypothetical protein ABMA64_15510 [Myxococcota bacterium]